MGPSEAESFEAGEDGQEPTEETEVRALTITAAQHGARLDLALAALIPELSRSYLKQLIERGAARREDQVLQKVSRTVRAGENWTLEMRPTAQSQAYQPQALPLDIRYQDEDLLILSKAAGMVVHPAPGNWSGTLLNALLAFDSRCQILPRAGIVHRLDKDTSGLMVVARSRVAFDALTRMISERVVHREYLALAHRCWSGPVRRSFEQAIGRDPRNRLRMAVVDLHRQSGRPARTDVRLLEQAEAGCLLACKLFTGRTHQIRVHLASAGHPLLSDEVYGGAPGAGMGRQALHAWQLGFNHPISGQAQKFEAPPPPDFQQAICLWGLGYNAAKWLEEPAL